MDGIRINTLAITPEILGLISQIDEFKGAWTALGRISPERLSSLRRVATIESAGSSTRIEGAKLSDKEVDALLSKIAVKAVASRDEEEVAGYAAVMETIFASWPEIALTENHIRHLHRAEQLEVLDELFRLVRGRVAVEREVVRGNGVPTLGKSGPGSEQRDDED